MMNVVRYENYCMADVCAVLVKDQTARISNLGEQVEKSYVQAQAIAVKEVEGSAANPSGRM